MKFTEPKIDTLILGMYLMFVGICALGAYQCIRAVQACEIQVYQRLVLESVSVTWDAKPSGKFTNVYRPTTGDDTLTFCSKVITNIDMWREATRE